MSEQVGADLMADARGTEFVLLGEGDRALFAVAAEAFGDIARGGGSSDRVPVALANRLSVLLETGPTQFQVDAQCKQVQHVDLVKTADNVLNNWPTPECALAFTDILASIAT